MVACGGVETKMEDGRICDVALELATACSLLAVRTDLIVVAPNVAWRTFDGCTTATARGVEAGRATGLLRTAKGVTVAVAATRGATGDARVGVVTTALAAIVAEVDFAELCFAASGLGVDVTAAGLCTNAVGVEPTVALGVTAVVWTVEVEVEAVATAGATDTVDVTVVAVTTDIAGAAVTAGARISSAAAGRL